MQNTAQPTLWHYADPTDILNLPGGTPAQEYGLLQSTGTQKLFFAQPQVTETSRASSLRCRRTSRTSERC